MISANEKMMETMPQELKRIMSQVEVAVRNGKTRYLISNRCLKPEYERILVSAGYNVKRGLIITQISW